MPSSSPTSPSPLVALVALVPGARGQPNLVAVPLVPHLVMGKGPTCTIPPSPWQCFIPLTWGQHPPQMGAQGGLGSTTPHLMG